MKVLPADVGGEGVRECLLKGWEVQLPEGGRAADVILPQPALRLVDTCSSSSGRTVFHELFLRALKTKTMICQDRLGTNKWSEKKKGRKGGSWIRTVGGACDGRHADEIGSEGSAVELRRNALLVHRMACM